ncbi:MAG: hypothetical protein F4X03_06860 [Dehalococcoidia bacterium]|nr:hypothetical protein [Dehalococcoidia bacterium]MYD28615.1 hypothetical protein [Dehalococcoidia bacterium]
MPERMKADQRARLHRAHAAYNRVYGEPGWCGRTYCAVAYDGTEPYFGDNFSDVRRQVIEAGGRTRQVDAEIAREWGKRTRLPCLFSTERPSDSSFTNCVERFQETNEEWLRRNATPEPPPPYGWWDLFYDIITSPFVSWLR